MKITFTLYFFLLLTLFTTSSISTAEVRITDLNISAEAEECLIFDVNTQYNHSEGTSLPHLRAYALIDNERAPDSSYRPFAYVLPGRHTVRGKIRRYKKENTKDFYTGIHVGAYDANTEELLEMTRIPYPKTWDKTKSSSTAPAYASIGEVKTIYESDDVLILEVDYEYKGENFCDTAITASATCGGNSALGSRPQTLVPGKNKARVELSLLNVDCDYQLSNTLNLRIYQYNPSYKELVTKELSQPKEWLLNENAKTHERDFCETWKEE